MKSIITNGLFIVLVCTISARLNNASTVREDYDDDEYIYEDYEYDGDNSQIARGEDYEGTSETSELDDPKITLVHNVTTEENISKVTENQEIVKVTSEATILKVDENVGNKTASVQGVLIEELELLQNENCPRPCTCDEELQFIDCSNHSLSGIPKNLPNTSLHINLNNNDIKEIQENDFSNLTVLRQIVLKNNQIQNIDGNVFQSLHRLDLLDLSFNNLSKIDPDLFQHAQGLSLLSLNYNPIAFEANQPFLNLPNLQILNLVGCNITEVYNETFMNLTDLTSLNLADNSLADDINVDAFNPLYSLLKLKIPHVSQTATYGLCRKISVIDVISFDNYNISCYELISGSSYDESTITHGPTLHVENTTMPMRSASTSTPTSILEEPEISTSSPEQNITETPKISTKSPVVDSSAVIHALNTTNGENVKKEEVEQSAQSIKTILIASIGIAVIGLIIGLICRKDVFGVKTKLCRTQRPEPPSIPEQVPLNKV